MSNCFQKSVYTFFEALAICHTVQVAGKYDENEDRSEEDRLSLSEEEQLLSFDGEIPPIFHKSLEELNDLDSVHEEIDFISSRQSITYEHRNGNSKEELPRPMSDIHQLKKQEFTHRRPSSLSNIQFVNQEGNSTENPANVKHVEFSKENLLLRRVQQQQFKRAISSNVETEKNNKELHTHRRTKSSVPFGSGKFDQAFNILTSLG